MLKHITREDVAAQTLYRQFSLFYLSRSHKVQVVWDVLDTYDSYICANSMPLPNHYCVQHFYPNFSQECKL